MSERVSDMDVDTDRDAVRRRAILDAARSCFVQFGYAKTSIDDIATRARISRPLVYRKFKNKEDIYGAVFEDIFSARYPAAQAILRGRGTRKERLFKVYDLLCVDTWAIIADAPMARDFYQACLSMAPEIARKHDRRMLAITRELLGDPEVSEVFMLAVEGLYMDLPTAAVLRRRLRVLVDRFCR
jgi:AcrR family transcriptional regulator